MRTFWIPLRRQRASGWLGHGQRIPKLPVERHAEGRHNNGQGERYRATIDLPRGLCRRRLSRARFFQETAFELTPCLLIQFVREHTVCPVLLKFSKLLSENR